MEWTGARYADRPTAEASTWIDGDPEVVWRYVSDVRLMPELSEELQRVECRGDGPLEVGASWVGLNKHEALGEWTTTSYVVEREQPHVFAWAVSDPEAPTATWRFTLTPENGGTRLTQWTQMGPAPSGISLAIERMPDKEQKIVFVRLRELETAMIATVAAIKDRVEATR